MNTEIQAFEASREHFVTTLKGKPLEKLKQQDVAVGLANILLKDAATSWSSSYGPEGRWLNQYTRNNPEKGKVIKSALNNDMMFTEDVRQEKPSPYMKYGAVIAGAVIGGGVAGVFTSKLIPKLVAAALPAAAIYPMMTEYEKNSIEGGKAGVIGGYMDQLDKFRVSVIRIIEG